ncbi:MAG TPA: hypothetical protein VF473_05600, partial [Cyclobacteriaceae bacterium]
MIRRVLFLVMISVSSYAQDTLAVIDAKYKPRDQEIFIHGDSTFIRLVYSDAYAPWSTAGWYSSGRQLAEVNLEILASRKLLGVQRFGDTVYYYGYTAQARKTTVTTVRLVGVSEPVKIGEQTVEGTLLGIKERGRNLSLVTLDRKGKKFKVFELRKGKATAAGELSYTWKIENIGLNDISFQDASGSWGSCSINVQLHGNTLAAVFDDRNPNAEDPVATRRTLIIRKDL